MFAPLAFAAGALTWSFAEYRIHRFVGHGKPKRSNGRPKRGISVLAGDFGPEHLKHHVDPTYFASTKKKVQAAAIVLGAGGVVTSLVVGPHLGVAYTLGFTVTYAAYELTHRRAHTHPPTGRYSRWVRKNHFHHHFGSPKENHGVTSPIWDMVFGTHTRVDRVSVPDVQAPPWMVDDSGALRPEFAEDYALVKRGKKPTMKKREATAKARRSEQAA